MASPEADGLPPPPPPPPIDGTSDAADPPSFSSLATSAASPALDAAKSAEQPGSPSLLPSAEVVEFYTEAAASNAPSAQITEASPEDTPPASSPPTPPAPIPCSPLDASCTESVAMASLAAMGADAGSYTTPEPSTPPLGSRLEGFQQQQQQPQPLPSPTATPHCDGSELTQLALPPPSPAEIAHALPDAVGTDGLAATPEEASRSSPAMEVTSGETDAVVSMPQELERGAEGPLQEPMQSPPSPAIAAEPSSPEMAPPGFENFKSSWLPLPPPTPPADSMPSLLVAAASPKAVVVMPEEAIESAPSVETLDAGKPCSVTQDEPNSPDMPPPGFENYKSSWLPLPSTPAPVETTDVLPDVVATKAVEAPSEEVAGPLPALQVMVETNTALNLLPALRGEELLQQPLLKPPSPLAQSECSPEEMAPPGFENFKSLSKPCSPEEMAPPGFENLKSSSEPCCPEEMAPPGFEILKPSSEPCSPEEMAPPGFENFKSSWPPLPTLSRTAYALPDAAATDALAVTVGEAAGAPPTLEAMDVDMDATHPPPPASESGVEGSLQEPPPRTPSPMMQDAPCLPDMAPPGFETYNSSQLQLSSPPLAHTAFVQQDPPITEAVPVIEEAPQALHPLEVMDVNMDTVPPLLLSSENREDGPFPQQSLQLPSPAEKGKTCLPDMLPSGCGDLELSQLPPPPPIISPLQTPDGSTDVPAIDRIAVASKESPHEPLVSEGMEDGTASILSSLLENGSKGSPQLESQPHSPTAQASDILLDAPGSKPGAVVSKEIAQPSHALQAANTDLDSTTAIDPLSGNILEESSLQPQHQSSSMAQVAPCSQDSVQLVPPPPPPCLNKEIGQLVCGSCRTLLAYFRGAVHVHCTCCQTINLVLEAHEVGKVHCGRCQTLLMYPFGAPAVKCSLCQFVTEIGDRNVRPRVSIEQAVPPHPPELTPQG